MEKKPSEVRYRPSSFVYAERGLSRRLAGQFLDEADNAVPKLWAFDLRE